MIPQNSTRSTSSSNSSSSSGRKAVTPAVLNFTLYGSPAPRSVHRTTLGAARARPRRRSTKPTPPPPSTPELHLDLGSLASSGSEYDGSAKANSLQWSNAPGHQAKRHPFSFTASSTASSCHLSNKSSTRSYTHKNCRKVNHKSKVSQMLFQKDDFEKNKLNSFYVKNVKVIDTETAFPTAQPFQPISKYSQHNQKFVARRESYANDGQISPESVISDHISKENGENSHKIVCIAFNEQMEISMLDSTKESNKEDANISDSCSKEDNWFNFSVERNALQKELDSQRVDRNSQNEMKQITDTNEVLISVSTKEIKDVSINSGAKSYSEITNRLCKDQPQTSADYNNIIGLTLRGNAEDKLLEKEFKKMTSSNCEAIIKTCSSDANNMFPHDLEFSNLDSQKELKNYDSCANNVKIGKMSAHWFIPNDEGKGKCFKGFTHSNCDQNINKTSPEVWEKNPTGLTNKNSAELSARTDSIYNCVAPEDIHDIDIEEKEQEEEAVSSSQGFARRERKNSDASWSSYHSSTYTTLSDSTWGCSSDTYESFHSGDVSQGNISFNRLEELSPCSPLRNPSISPKSTTSINADNVNTLAQEHTNKDLEKTGVSSTSEWSSEPLQMGAIETVQKVESKATFRDEDDKVSIPDEIWSVNNASSNAGANQTRQSSSSGVTGSMMVDFITDVQQSSPEWLLEVDKSDGNENICNSKVSPTGHETPSEEWTVEEEEEEVEEEKISTTTTEELCLLCSCNFKTCRCPSVTNDNSRSTRNNSDDENVENLTESSQSFPKFIRNVYSAPACNCESGRRTKLLLQRLGYFTTAPDVLLSAGEVMEAAMYARQLVRVLECALDRALSLKMASFSETGSQSNLRRTRSLPTFSPKSSFTIEHQVPFSTEDASLNTAYDSKYNEQQAYRKSYNEKNTQEKSGLRSCFTDDALLCSKLEKLSVQESNVTKQINKCQERCYCCGPKLLNISPQELQQQKALLKPVVNNKPQSFTVIKDMASILKNVISHRRDIMVPPEDGACAVSRSLSEWSINE